MPLVCVLVVGAPSMSSHELIVTLYLSDSKNNYQNGPPSARSALIKTGRVCGYIICAVNKKDGCIVKKLYW